MTTADRFYAFLDDAAVLAPVAFDDTNDASSADPLRLRHSIHAYDSILYIHINTVQITHNSNLYNRQKNSVSVSA